MDVAGQNAFTRTSASAGSAAGSRVQGIRASLVRAWAPLPECPASSIGSSKPIAVCAPEETLTIRDAGDGGTAGSKDPVGEEVGAAGHRGAVGGRPPLHPRGAP